MVRLPTLRVVLTPKSDCPTDRISNFRYPVSVTPRHLILLLPAWLLSPTATPAAAQGIPAAAPEVLESLSGSQLTIRGSTTVGKRWSCTAPNVLSRVAVAPAEHTTQAAAIPEVRGVMIRVPVSALRCQNALMERAMRSALKADRDSAALNITGVFEIYDEFKPANPEEAHLAGALRVAGQERNVFLKAHVEPQADVLHVRSVLDLRLSDFDIERPRVLFGAVRARDAVSVEVELRYPRP